jgi:hypothetical protein
MEGNVIGATATGRMEEGLQGIFIPPKIFFGGAVSFNVKGDDARNVHSGSLPTSSKCEGGGMRRGSWPGGGRGSRKRWVHPKAVRALETVVGVNRRARYFARFLGRASKHLKQRMYSRYLNSLHIGHICVPTILSMISCSTRINLSSPSPARCGLAGRGAY